MVGIELDRGLLVSALVAAGYQVVAVNPLAASRYRERHGTSGAKSDRGDAKVLADLVRTDRHNHRPVAGDSDLAEAIRVLARAHQSAIWSRQRQLNSLRSALRACYPAALAAFGTDLASRDALAVLALAPRPSRAGSCPGPSSPRCWPAVAAGATLSSGRPTSRPACALRSWPPPRPSARPTGSWPTPPLGCWPASTSRSPPGRGTGRGVQHAPGRQDHPFPARTGDGPGRPGAGRVRR